MSDKIKNWFQDRYYDCYFWLLDKPFQRTLRGITQRFTNVLICMRLLALAIYSPTRFRNAIIDLIANYR